MRNFKKREILEMIKDHQITSEQGFRLLEELRRGKTTRKKGMDIAVVGMAGRFPGAMDIDEFWQNLVGGKDCIREIPKERWDITKFYDPNPQTPDKTYSKWGGFLSDIDKFDPRFFNISPREAELMDPQQRIFLEEAWKALEDAGYSDRRLEQKKCGVFVGCIPGDYIQKLERANISPEAYTFMGNAASILTARISYFLNLKGPSISIDTACSSSLVAIHLACESIVSGNCELAIAGGVSITSTEQFYMLASKAGMLSPTGKCKTFDNDADGFVPGEGVGVIILKPLAAALEDGNYIYGVIKGSALNQDGKTSGITAPSAPSQTAVECEVYDTYNIDPETISYIEAHGTGTKLGDPIEIQALTNAFQKYTQKKQFCAIGSVKSNIGHALTAAGIAGVIKLLLCLQHRKLVPSLNFIRENPHIDFQDSPVYVNTALKEWKPPFTASQESQSFPLRAAISSFGFSGTNAHVVFEESPVRVSEPLPDTMPAHLIVLSAKTEAALNRRIKDLGNWLRSSDQPSLSNVAYTLLSGRSHFFIRAAVVVETIAELEQKLHKICETGSTEYYFTRNLKATPFKPEPAIRTLGNRLITELRDNALSKREYTERLVKLGDLYCKGYGLDWEALYQGKKCRYLSLPPYPFATERYWVPERTETLDNTQRLHPLVHTNISTFEQYQFLTQLTGNEFYLTDHRISKDKVLPGVVYLEMVRAAGEIAGKRKVKFLKNIIWKTPITVKDTPEHVYTTLFPIQDGADYEVSTIKNNYQKISHFQGKLIYGDDTVFSGPDFLDIEAIKKRCPISKARVECYEQFRSVKMNYGQSFQGIKELRQNETEVLASIQLPPGMKENFSEFVLHPSLIDSALQTMIGLIAGNHEVQSVPLSLPFSLGEVEIRHPLSETCYAHLNFTGSQQKKENPGQQFNIVVTDEQGRVLVKISNLLVRALKEHRQYSPARSKAAGITYSHWIWDRSDSPSITTTGEKTGLAEGNHIVLFDTDQAIYEALITYCRENNIENTQIALVKPGTQYQDTGNNVYAINPENEHDYMQLVNDLYQQNKMPVQIFHLWQKASYSAEKLLDIQLKWGFYALFYLCKALMIQQPQTAMKICYLIGEHEKIQHENQENLIFSPAYEAISGFARTVRLENPRLLCKTIDIRRSTTPLPDIVLEELGHDDKHIEVRYEQEQRLIKRLKYLEIPKEQSEILLRENGVYIITGGSGKLGLIFAEYLAKQTNAKLVLAGRSALTPEKEAKIHKLESPDSEVVYIQADISNKKDVENLIRKTQARFGAIHGIIHSAGVIRDNYITKKRKEEIDAVLSPKIYGTLYLDQATRHERLDFFVLFSSITAVFGNAGQSDYAYANSFMDHFAHIREQLRCANKRYGKTLSINWTLWEEGGMMPDPQTRKLLTETLGLKTLETEAGLDAFAKALTFREESQLIVMNGEFKLSEETQQSQNRLSKEPHKEPLSSSSALSLPKPALLEKIRTDLLKMVSTILKVPEEDISLDEDISEYGFDSITITEFTNKINQHYDLETAPPIFFEHSTLSTLSQYLNENHHNHLTQYYGDSPEIIQQVEEHISEEKEGILEEDRQQDGVQVFETEKFSPVLETQPHVDARDAPIAIIGMSGILPQSEDLHCFWQHLVAGDNLITEAPAERWNWEDYQNDPDGKTDTTHAKWGAFIQNVETFDASFFNISPYEADLMDPQQRLFLETVWKAIEDAGYKPSELWGTRTGVFVGVSTADYGELLRDNKVAIDAYSATGMAHSIVANRVSYFFNLSGPSEAIDTACSSSTVAINRAINAIHQGECELGIVGGVNLLLSPGGFIAFSKAGMLCPDGKVKTFDKDANGYVRGEGVGVVVLKPLQKAQQDHDHIYALIKGSAVNHGGRSRSLTAPNPIAQSEVIIDAYTKAGISPDTISYIEAQGTATPIGDPVEIEAYKKAFKELNKRMNSDKTKTGYCGIGSLKPNIGHLEAASGMASLCKVVLALQYQTLPATTNFQELNPYIDIDNSPFYIVKTTKVWEPFVDEHGTPLPRRSGVHSFGFGGVNAHLVIEEYIPPEKNLSSASGQESEIFIFSAKSENTLRVYIENIHRFLSTTEHVSLSDMAYTLQVGRDAMECRLAIIAEDQETLIQQLELYLQHSEASADHTHIFIGPPQQSRDSLTRLTNGALGSDIIHLILANRSLQDIALLWIEHVDIPWEKLHEGRHVQRLSLPTYPFERRWHWIPQHHKREEHVNRNTNILQTTSQTIPENHNTSQEHIQQWILGQVSSMLNLKEKDINIEADLKAYGVDSLAAMRIINELRQYYGDTIITNDLLFQTQTIQELAEGVYSRLISCTSSKRPLSSLDACSHSSSDLKTENIFITGGTGVLGGKMIFDLLQQTNSQLYCLVRAKDHEHAKERIKTLLHVYDPEGTVLPLFDQRVIPVVGDILDERLGLEQKSYNELIHTIDMVLHIAGKVNLHGRYEDVKPVNVDGTRNMLHFALQTQQKYFVYISTYGVMGDKLHQGRGTFSEKDFEVNQEFEKLGYQQSKFEAEKMVRLAAKDGLKWIIIRPGNIFGESCSGCYPLGMTGVTGVFYDVLKTIIEMKLAAKSTGYFDMTPVDYVSQGIIYASTSRKKLYETYHLVNSGIRFDEIVSLIKSLGYPIELVSGEEYIKRLTAGENTYHSITTELTLFMPEIVLTTEGTIADDLYTRSVLKQANIFCAQIDTTLLKTYLDYCIKTGYLSVSSDNEKLVASKDDHDKEKLMNRKLCKMERIALNLDQCSAYNFGVVVHLKESLPEHIVKKALDIVQKCHVNLNGFIKVEDYPVFVEHKEKPIPLRVIAQDKDKQWVEEIEKELNTQIDREKPPLARSVLVTRHSGCDLLLIFNHIISDAISAFSFLQEVLEMCAELLTGKSVVEKSKVPKIFPYEDLFPKDINGMKGFWMSLGFIWKQIVSPKSKPLSDFSYFPISQRHVRIIHQFLSEEETTRIVLRGKRENTTMQAVLCATLLLTLNDWIQSTLGRESPISIACGSVVDLRKYFTVPVSEKQMGYWVSQVTSTHKVGKHSNFWNVAGEIKKELQKAIHNHEGFIVQKRFLFSRLHKNPGDFIKIFDTPRPHVLVTNVGRQNFPKEFGPIHVQKVHYTLRFPFYQGNKWGVILSANTFDQRLALNFHYTEPYWQKEEMQTFTHDCMERLRHAGMDE